MKMIRAGKLMGTSIVAVCVIATACSTSDSDPQPSASHPAGSSSAVSPTSASPEFAATLAPLIEKTMKDNVIPGSVVTVSWPGHGDWAQAFGTRTIGANEPMTVDDHFRVGSNTKTMTSTVILQLVQEGKLALDDPIGKYIPGVPNGDRITIAQLSEMRSGLYSYTLDPGFNATLDADPGKVWRPQELLDIAFSHEIQFEPGARFDYCNTNIVLLGLLIEKLTGKTASAAFSERIFEPLGLKNTSLPLPPDAAIPDPHPNGYSFGTNVSTINTYELPAAEQPLALNGTLKPNNETDANPSWAWTAGGAISTMRDLSTYVRALVGGGLLDPQMQQIRMSSITPTDPDNPAAAGYGLGIARFGPELTGHDGQIPGFMTFMGHDPKTGLTITIGTNLATVPTGEGSALTILKAIMPVFYGEGSVPGADPAAAPSSAAVPTSTTMPATPTPGG
jgi:D-alanyl-D-alanine carboxypeptidase